MRALSGEIPSNVELRIKREKGLDTKDINSEEKKWSEAENQMAREYLSLVKKNSKVTQLRKRLVNLTSSFLQKFYLLGDSRTYQQLWSERQSSQSLDRSSVHEELSALADSNGPTSELFTSINRAKNVLAQQKERLNIDGSFADAIKDPIIKRNYGNQLFPFLFLEKDIESAQDILDNRLENYSKQVSSTLFAPFKELARWFTWEKSPHIAGSLHFIASYTTFTVSTLAGMDVWNTYFGARSYLFSPIQGMYFLLFPKAFQRINSTNINDLAPNTSLYVGELPTFLNGGKVPFYEVLYSLLDPSENTSAYNEFEKKIQQVEKVVYKKAFELALSDLSRHSNSLQTANLLLANGGPQRIDERNIRKLSTKTKTFFQTHFMTLFNGAMHRYLDEEISSIGSDLNFQELKSQPRKLKKVLVQRITSLRTMTPERAKGLVAEVSKSTSSYETAIETSRKFFSFQRFAQNLDLSAVKEANPAFHPQAKRMVKYMVQKQDPKSVARAVRASITHFLVDKPIQLLMTLLFTAGVEEGVMKPLHQERFSDLSINYFSRVLLGWWVYDIFASFLANPWMKIQMDVAHVEHFDDVPTAEQAEKGFVPWFLRKTFANPNNRLWDNQRIYNKIITDNIKAYFATTLAIDHFSLSRLDLDKFVGGYMVAYLPGYQGMGMTLDQGIDMSMNYGLAKFPKEIRGHPLVQDYFTKWSQDKRMKFNFLYHTLWENPLGYFFSNLSLGQSRGLIRIPLAGWTITEAIAAQFDDLYPVLPDGSSLENAARTCDQFFTENYEAYKVYQRQLPAHLKK